MRILLKNREYIEYILESYSKACIRSLRDSRAQHVEPKSSAPVLEESLKNSSRHSRIQNAAKGFKMVEVSPRETESRETSGIYMQVAWGRQHMTKDSELRASMAETFLAPCQK